jgi:hypothetical protein
MSREYLTPEPNREHNRPSILASHVEVGAVFKSTSNHVYKVRSSRHNEAGKVELYATGDYLFSLTNTPNRIANRLNEWSYTRVPIVYDNYRLNEISGRLNRDYFTLFFGDYHLGKGDSNFLGESVAQEVCGIVIVTGKPRHMTADEAVMVYRYWIDPHYLFKSEGSYQDEGGFVYHTINLVD